MVTSVGIAPRAQPTTILYTTQKQKMAENNTRMKAIAGVAANLIGPLNEAGEEGILNATPNITPGGEISPSPSEDLTILHEKGASTSTAKETAPVVKKLL